MKNLILTILFFLFLINTYSQIDSLYNYTDEINVFVIDSMNNEVFYNRRHIPRVLKKTIKEYFNSDFRIANPNRRYNSTDVIYPLLPNKQMLFLIKNKNRYALVYERGGGRISHTVFIYAEIISSKVIHFKVFNVRTIVTSVDDFLNKVIIQKKYVINKENKNFKCSASEGL